MDLSGLENYIFIPDPQPPGGMLYELSSSEGFKPGSFVLLPYANPLVKKLEPRFYSIKTKIRIKDLSPFRKKKVAGPILLKAVQSKQKYLEQVRALKQQIQLGNIYEINYCIQFYAQAPELDPVGVFTDLHQLAKAPYAALLKLGSDFIIGASPELFLKKEAGLVFTKPIKGTSRRGKNAEEDEALKKTLFESVKERTENVMAVDVARNDLSQFAKKGTVHVNKLYNIETFETVHQMVSTISCELKENTSFEKIVDSAFPMASMTGAPKRMAMKLIDEHEGFERRYYSGAMGLVDEKGDFTLSVIIRSIFFDQDTERLLIAVGSAITYLSDPEQEYEECFLKANAMLKALNASLSDA